MPRKVKKLVEVIRVLAKDAPDPPPEIPGFIRKRPLRSDKGYLIYRRYEQVSMNIEPTRKANSPRASLKVNSPRASLKVNSPRASRKVNSPKSNSPKSQLNASDMDELAELFGSSTKITVIPKSVLSNTRQAEKIEDTIDTGNKDELDDLFRRFGEVSMSNRARSRSRSRSRNINRNMTRRSPKIPNNYSNL